VQSQAKWTPASDDVLVLSAMAGQMEGMLGVEAQVRLMNRE
jgi:hypothetical protein